MSTTKKITLREFKSLIKKIIKESVLYESPFNGSGEPVMTHKQYVDYSESSEMDYDSSVDNDYSDIRSELKKELEKNDLLLESFNGREYFIRCRDELNQDFMIYFINDDEIEIHNVGDREEKNIFGFGGALKYILKNKKSFYTFSESVQAMSEEDAIEAVDRKNNRMERGTYN